MRRYGSFALILAMLALPQAGADDGGDGRSWMERVEQQIAADEYEISWQDRTVLEDLDRAWHAPNRAHNLRTYFTPEGIRVVRRTTARPPWQWTLSLIGYGRGDAVAPVAEARLLPSGNRIDYFRGPITEWYVNDSRGLEQGLTLELPPEGAELRRGAVGGRGRRFGEADEEHAFVVLSLGGDLSPRISTDGQAIDFIAPGGARALRYSHLLVTDARGRELPASMEGFGGTGVRGIRIVFDDREATYPVTIDPLATTPAWTAESDQVSGRLGISVSTAGDVNGDGYSDVIVGAYLYDNGEADEGRAYVYHGSASGLSDVASWTAESDQAGARLGWSVSLAGDVDGDGYGDVIVGAPLFDNGEKDEGRAFLYRGSATGLAASPAWTAEGDQVAANFGGSVAIAGDVNADGYADVIVGADAYDNGQVDEGRAWVYHGSAAGPSATADWIAESDQAGAAFGYDVQTAGDVNADGYADVIVGASLYDGGQTDEGRALLYFGSASGLSTVADWSSESNVAGAQYGHAVSTAGDVDGDGYADVLVGAHLYAAGETDEGRAYLYRGGASGPSATADWSLEGDQVDAWFGDSVSTAGDVNGDGYADVIIGARRWDNVEINEGRAFVFHGSAAGLAAIADWSAEADQNGARFGVSVATAGDVDGDGYADVIIGSYLENNGETDEGRAYVYHGGAAGLSAMAGWTADSQSFDSQLGFSVSTAGDVNGDGYDDVIVGERLWRQGQSQEGRALVYHGSALGVESVESWSIEEEQERAQLGFAVARAGDVDGDGYDDVIVGAPYFDNGQADEGRAFVYLGSAAGLGTVAAWTAESDQDSALFGYHVSSAGDVNGDGYADVIVSALHYSNGESQEGRAYVYHGSASGLSLSENWSAESNQVDAFFGRSVSTAGDVNGDGYDDVIIGASHYDNGEIDEGRAFIYRGSATGLGAVATWTGESNQAGARFGYSVSTAGDVDGDGYSDVIVGADGYDDPETDEGAAWIYYGSSAGIATSFGPLEADQASASFGSEVSTAGDVNGDGYSDVIVGALYYSNGEDKEGRVFVYLGSSSFPSWTPDWTAESDKAGAYFGASVSTAGDVNGDGYADVIVGASQYGLPPNFRGRAYVFYGNDGAGLSLKPEQRRADDQRPIAQGGRSRDSGAFRLAVTGRVPFGRGKVQLEWEVKPFGSPFDGTGTSRSAWLDTGTAGAVFNELISALEPGGKHWRMRLHYDAATTPFQRAGRWLTSATNGWQEQDLSIASFVGGQVWEDRDGDGIMATEEPRLSGVAIDLLDDTGAVIGATVSAGDGTYRFEVEPDVPVRVRFVVPGGWRLTAQDQGVDDMVDSDADTVSGQTALIAPPFESIDEQRWSAGLRRAGICTPPDEAVYLYAVTLSTDGNDYPVLNFQDPNQPDAVTGYNIYRSSDAGLPHGQWPRLADDVIDMDEAEPNKQWTDTSGDVSPTGSWFYQVAPYNHDCPSDTAEGPW